MIVLKGELTAAEVAGTAEPAPALRPLPRWAPVGIPAGFVLGGLILGALADVFVPATQGMAWNLGWASGLALYFVWRARPQWFGLVSKPAAPPPRLTWKLIMTPKQLGYDFGAASFRVEWGAVAALSPTGESWTFESSSGPVRAPRRLMAGPGEEAAFLKRSLGYLSETARAASPDAVRRAGA
jgi:hypothetical protein